MLTWSRNGTNNSRQCMFCYLLIMVDQISLMLRDRRKSCGNSFTLVVAVVVVEVMYPSPLSVSKFFTENFDFLRHPAAIQPAAKKNVTSSTASSNMADDPVSVLLALRYSVDTADDVDRMHANNDMHRSTLSATTFDEDDQYDDTLCAESLTHLCLPLLTPSIDGADKSSLPSKRPLSSSTSDAKRAGAQTPAAPAKVSKAAAIIAAAATASSTNSVCARTSFSFSSSSSEHPSGRKSKQAVVAATGLLEVAAAAAAADPAAGLGGTVAGQGRRGRYRCSKCGALKVGALSRPSVSSRLTVGPSLSPSTFCRPTTIAPSSSNTR